MIDHSRCHELAALSAAGYLSDEEFAELVDHRASCAECRQVEVELSELFRLGLPLTRNPLREFGDKIKTRADEDLTARFLQRARSEGIVFSPSVESLYPNPRRQAGFWPAFAMALIAAVIVLGVYAVRLSNRLSTSREPAQAIQPHPSEDPQEIAALNTKLSGSQQRITDQANEITALRARMGEAAKAADEYRRANEKLTADSQESVVRNAQVLADIQNREKLLAEAKTDLDERNQTDRTADQASNSALEFRIKEVSEQLRVANANLELDRQLLAGGRDVREIMGARGLHVVDVRDAGPTGKGSKPFGRVFLTEGKSLTFYAFDLNDGKSVNPKQTFEVWGQQEGKPGSSRSLGFLYVDDKAQKRWALNVDNPDLIKEVDSVFVTVEPAGGAKQPSGPRMLYAFLGEANHP